MKITRYFEEQVLRKRPYIDPASYESLHSLADDETNHNASFDRRFRGDDP